MFVVKLLQVFLLYLMAKVVFVKRSSIILSSDSGIIVLKISISFFCLWCRKQMTDQCWLFSLYILISLCLQLLFYEPIGCLLLT